MPTYRLLPTDSGDSTSSGGSETSVSGCETATMLPLTVPLRKQRSSGGGGAARVAALSSLATLLVSGAVLLCVLHWAPPGSWQQVSQGARWANRTASVVEAAPCAAVLNGTIPDGVTMRRPVALALGDSVTEFGDAAGWVGLLRYAYHSKLDVLNRGMGGYTSRWYRTIFEDMLYAERNHNITLAILMFGTNDATDPIDPSGERWHVPLDEYRDNLVFMVEALRRVNATHIILMTPPPVDDAKRVEWMKKTYNKTTPDRTTALVKPYAEATISVAQQFGLPYVDLWTDMQKFTKNWGPMLFFDGMHPTPTGHLEMSRLLTMVMQRQIPELNTDHMPHHYPSWFQLGIDPVETLTSLPLATLD